jgi:hypothetical protein
VIGVDLAWFSEWLLFGVVLFGVSPSIADNWLFWCVRVSVGARAVFSVRLSPASFGFLARAFAPGVIRCWLLVITFRGVNHVDVVS